MRPIHSFFRPRQWLSARVMKPMMALLMALSVISPALAHKGSDAYLDVQQLAAPATPALSATSSAADRNSAQGLVDFKLELAVAIRDLDLVVPIDANADAQVTWGEIKTATPQILSLLNETAALTTTIAAADTAAPPAREPTQKQVDGPGAICPLSWQADGLERRSDGVYFRAAAEAHCPAGQALGFYYVLLKEQDATHRLLVTGHIGGKDLLSTMSPQQGSMVLAATVANTPGAANDVHAQSAETDHAGRWSTLRSYFSLGMHHLLEGYDHLAFLLALVLPLQLSLRRPKPGRPRAAPTSTPVNATHADNVTDALKADHWRANWLALLRTVTAFTVGHSITLILATLGFTQASPLWVEPAIAASIAVTALLNIYPVKGVRFDVLALLFGLIHGYGFAGLLIEAAAPSGLLPWALTGFNVGVEAGQLTAVLGWVLVSQALVGKAWYPRVVVRGGSVVLLVLAAGWFWQRVS